MISPYQRDILLVKIRIALFVFYHIYFFSGKIRTVPSTGDVRALAVINQKSLHNCLDSFCDCTGIPVTLYTPEGIIREEFLPEQKFCKFFNTPRMPGECSKNLRFSTQISYEMGEAYVYYCPVGLVHISVPVIVDKQYCASAVAGPLAMGEIGDHHLSQALAMDHDALSEVAKIALFISKMKVYTPTQIQKISQLFFGAVLQSHKNWEDYEQLQSRYNQQIEAGEHIRKRKEAIVSHISPSLTCAELEEQFTRELRARNRENALSCLHSLLNELILLEGGNLDSIKLHILELYISLSCSASEEGIPLRKIIGNDFALINSLNRSELMGDFYGWASKMVNHFIDDVFVNVSNMSDTMSRAVTYIAAHYMEKFTLRELATKLFVSDSYLSKLFRLELNSSFTDYLNRTRIDHSTELMKNTDLSILEVSGMVGFEDQSYFTKVFKRAIGETPKQYRKQLKNPEGTSASGFLSAPDEID